MKPGICIPASTWALAFGLSAVLWALMALAAFGVYLLATEVF